jgi:hypothetical protein
VTYWIFKGNPERYDLDGRLRHPDPKTSWNATRYRDDLVPGDIAFIWRTGPKGGIVAVMRLDSRPQEIAEVSPDASYWLHKRETGPAWRVLGTFTHRIRCLQRERILLTPGLENLSIFRGFQQATNFRASEAEGEILMKLVEASAQI